jgi:hypothetical protein
MDVIYKEWFDTTTVKVSIELAHVRDFLSKTKIIELTGAPKGSLISVKRDGNTIGFKVSNAIFAEDMHYFLVREPDGASYHIKNVVLVLREEFTNQGIGTRCVIKEIHAAAKLAANYPIHSIKLDAIGNHDFFDDEKYPMRGYYVWARIGFDGEIPDSVKPRLSSVYRGCQNISELMRDSQGRKEWLRHGDSAPLTFDLHPNSNSWKLLSQYMNEKEIQL